MDESAPRSSKIVQRVLVLLIFATPFLYWDALHASSALPRHAFIGLSAGVGLLLWSLGVFRRRQDFVWHPWFGALLLLFTLSSISITWGVDPYNGFILLAALIGNVAVCFLVLQVGTADFALTLAKTATVAGALCALIALGQYFGFNPLHYYQAAKPAGSFGNKNFLALYLDLVFPLALTLMLFDRRARWRWLWSLCTALCLSFLIASRTRGSWLGLLVAATAGAIVLWRIPGMRAQWAAAARRQRWVLAVVAIAPIVIAVAPGSVLPPGYKIRPLLHGHLSGGIETRLHAWDNALQMIEDHPLEGIGFGGFRMGFRPYMFSRAPMFIVTIDRQLGRLHNDPLQQFVELGIFGGLLSIGIYAWALWLAWSLIRDSNGRERWLAMGLFLALVASGAHACVSFPFRRPASALLLVAWLGLLAGMHARQGKRLLSRPSPWVLGLLGLVGLGIATGAVAFYTPSMQANRQMQSAIDSLGRRDCPAALSHIDAAWHRFKLEFTVREMYVRVYGICDGNAGEVLSAMNKVLAYDPTDTRALLTRGQVYLYQRKYKQAAEDFRLVTALLPSRPGGYLGLGNVAQQVGKYQWARQYYQTAQDREPNNPQAAKFLKLLDKLEAAAKKKKSKVSK